MRELMMANAAHSLTQLSACCGIALAMSACVPYPHSVTRNPAIEGRVLSAATGQAVAGAKVEMDIGSDESWAYETVSDAEGRFAFAEHNDYRLYALLADAPRCGTTLSISAPGYHTRHCTWMNMHWCSSTPLQLPRLMLQPEHIAISEEEAVEDFWSCIESAMEQAH
ncbi:carboxypeptidase-like regulatory domain-containing protein [Aquipseudomonas ullengensis]|uniref:Carboxypeptidase regulatory-like domain-containing protein n=1 Tax=Aquipseudomonas ullengensis TaxID=2759166 RepID=A0A7W4Q925_9GAMM|nr:carboxypeptidase-like regulatory domain-containing protein [Pseudomonas ullengensis]MBB2494249.1 carboxypeptidase regulatory-like domain-containing protein [Pseudomonas ullengensis]